MRMLRFHLSKKELLRLGRFTYMLQRLERSLLERDYFLTRTDGQKTTVDVDWVKYIKELDLVSKAKSELKLSTFPELEKEITKRDYEVSCFVEKKSFAKTRRIDADFFMKVFTRLRNNIFHGSKDFTTNKERDLGLLKEGESILLWIASHDDFFHHSISSSNFRQPSLYCLGVSFVKKAISKFSL